jgi:hypothetical protein
VLRGRRIISTEACLKNQAGKVLGAEMRRLFDQLKHDRYLTGLGREEFARKGAHFLARSISPLYLSHDESLRATRSVR